MPDDKPRVVLLGPEDSAAEAIRVLTEAGVSPESVLVGEEAEQHLAKLWQQGAKMMHDITTELDEGTIPVPTPPVQHPAPPRRQLATTWHEGENRAQRRCRQRLERKGVINVSAIARSIEPKGCTRDHDESNHHAEYIGTDEE